MASNNNSITIGGMSTSAHSKVFRLTVAECIAPLHLIVKTPTLHRTDLKTSFTRANSNMVAIHKVTNNKTSMATTMVQIEGATFSIPNKIAVSLGRDLARRTSHRPIEGAAGISIICNGMPTTSVADHKIRVILGAMQDRTILHPHPHPG